MKVAHAPRARHAPRAAIKLLSPHALRYLGVPLVILVVATSVAAQGTPMPVPTGGAGGAPIYVQPAPSSGSMRPGQAEAPEPAAPAMVDTALPTVSLPPGKEAAKPLVRQMTAFPELTRGIGNSQALLGE